MSESFGGAANVAVVVTLSQAPQCGWETWFSCKYGRELAKLRAPVRSCTLRGVATVVQALNKQLTDNRAALDKPIANKAVQWKRVAACTTARVQLAMVRELMLVSPATPAVDPHDTAAWAMPTIAPARFAMPGSAAPPLAGRWDPFCYETYLMWEAGYGEPCVLEEFFFKTSVAKQRVPIDKEADSYLLHPDHKIWFDRCPATTMCVDTTAFPPCDNARVDVFVHRPPAAGGDTRTPAVVYCHGGGGLWGKARQVQCVCARIALENNCTVFNVEYRLAPEDKAPAAIFDIVGVVLHLHANAASLGVDATRIALSGESGGGYLCAGAALELARRGLQDKVKLCVPHSPHASDIVIREATNVGIEGPKAVWMWHGKQLGPSAEFNDPAYVWLNKTPKKILAQCPLTVVITAEFDSCRRSSEDYAMLLYAQGRLLDLLVHPGGNHCWGIMMDNPRADVFWADFSGILRKYLL